VWPHRPVPRLAKSELEDLHRHAEQALAFLGILQPGQGRAQGGPPQDVVDALTADLDRLWEELAQSIQQALRESQGKTAVDPAALETLFAGFQSHFEDLLTHAVGEAIQAGVADAGEDLGEEIAFASVDPGLVQSLQQQAVILCEATTAKIRGSVKAALVESMRLGENLTQTIARLQSLSSLSTYEAERIARTELARAANAGRLQGYKGRVEKVRWVLGPTYAGGCACGDMAGVYTLAEAAGLSMPLHPNCDCLWVAEVPEAD
jgi:hypothetical protein